MESGEGVESKRLKAGPETDGDWKVGYPAFKLRDGFVSGNEDELYEGTGQDKEGGIKKECFSHAEDQGLIGSTK